MKLRSLIFAAALALPWGSAFAQEFPTKPVTMIVPYAAGGPTDVLARAIADKLATTFRQEVIVENRAGAAAIVGMTALQQAAPDGYTILLGAGATNVIATLLQDPPYNILEDFQPVGYINDTPLVLAIHPSVPVNSVQELIQYAKDNPGKLNGYSTGTGTTNHLALEMFNSQAGIKVQHVPYNGGAAAVKALVANEVQLGFDGLILPLGLSKRGEVKLLAVTTEQRVPVTPELPTFVESGLPEFVVGSWYGFYAPKGTPQDIVDKLYASISEVMTMPEIEQQFDELGLVVRVGDAAEMQQRTLNELDQFKKVIEAANIEPN